MHFPCMCKVKRGRSHVQCNALEQNKNKGSHSWLVYNCKITHDLMKKVQKKLLVQIFLNWMQKRSDFYISILSFTMIKENVQKHEEDMMTHYCTMALQYFLLRVCRIKSVYFAICLTS